MLTQYKKVKIQTSVKTTFTEAAVCQQKQMTESLSILQSKKCKCKARKIHIRVFQKDVHTINRHRHLHE